MSIAQKRTVFLSAALLLGASSALAQDGISITDIAPAESFLVVGIDDWASFKASFDDSPLGALWADQRIRSIAEELLTEARKNLIDQLEDLDLDLDDIQTPSGGVGIAAYLSMDEDEEPQPHFVAIGEYGENADDWSEFIAKLLERAEDDELALISEEEYQGATITTFEVLEVVDEDDEHAGHNHAMNESSSPFADFETFYLARIEDTFIVGSELMVVESAIDGVNGDAVDSINDNETFHEAMAQHEHEQEQDVFGVLLTESLFETMLPIWNESSDGFGEPSIEDMLDISGLLEVEAISASYAFGTNGSAIDGSIAILVPVKKGLLELIDGEAGPADPPAFVGPDVASLSSYYFRFDGLLDVVNSLVAKMPEATRGQLEMMISQFEPMYGPLLKTLGPQVHTYVSFLRPLTAESQLQVFAIEVSDEMIFSNSVTTLGGMFQLEGREFEGNRIFVSPDDFFAIGVGFGYAFIGRTTGVENAMRQAGRPDAARLATEPRFIDAAAAIEQNGIGHAYMDTRQMIEWIYWSAQNYVEIQSAWLDEAEFDDEFREEYLEDIRESQPEWMTKLPPKDAFLEHLGDMISIYTSTPDGFVVRSLLLSAGND